MQIWKGLKVFIIISVCVYTLLAQTYPYVSFKGQTLAKYSYVDLSLVGSDDTSSVQCITDLSTCCTGEQGAHRGDWYFPNGTRLPFTDSSAIYENRLAQRVDLRRKKNQNYTPGMYHCNISTIAVHKDADADDDTSVGEIVYVGLYHSGGEQYHPAPPF